MNTNPHIVARIPDMPYRRLLAALLSMQLGYRERSRLGWKALVLADTNVRATVLESSSLRNETHGQHRLAPGAEVARDSDVGLAPSVGGRAGEIEWQFFALSGADFRFLWQFPLPPFRRGQVEPALGSLLAPKLYRKHRDRCGSVPCDLIGRSGPGRSCPPATGPAALAGQVHLGSNLAGLGGGSSAGCEPLGNTA